MIHDNVFNQNRGKSNYNFLNFLKALKKEKWILEMKLTKTMMNLILNNWVEKQDWFWFTNEDNESNDGHSDIVWSILILHNLVKKQYNLRFI